MKKIAFEKPDREAMADALQRHLLKEFDLEIGGLEAEMLLEFFAERIGVFYYNQGLKDALAVASRKLDMVADDVYALEQPTRPRRSS